MTDIQTFLDQILSKEKDKKNSLRAPERNPIVGAQADLAKKVKEYLNRYETKKLGNIDSTWNKYGAGHEIGSLLFGESPELLDDVSYEGLKALVSGRTGRLPIPDKRLLDVPVPIPSAGGLGVVKNKGGNWLTGSVERALKRLKKDVTYDDVIANNRRMTYENAQRLKEQEPMNLAINQWIDNQLTKYVKNRMATPDDEVRKLADQGISHYDPGTQNPYMSDIIKGKRASLSLDPNNTSKTEMGKSFEDLADTHVLVNPSNNYPGSYDYSLGNGLVGDLGFQHLIDELLNATNPNSGLPMNLRITPEGFKGLSMEEAVKKVHGINAFRAEQAEAARKRMSRAEGIPTTKIYDDGFRFVAPDDVTKNEKHREYVVDVGKRGAWCTQGDACDYYAGGDSRVQVLIDDFGNPHAQIAIKTSNSPEEVFRRASEQGVPRNILEKLDSKIENSISPEENFEESYRYLLKQELEKIGYEVDLDKGSKTISEIKPLANSWDSNKVKELLAKDPNYKQKIQEKLQDFVKSGDWSDVGDLENVGLYRLKDGRLVTQEEYAQIYEQNGGWMP